MSEIKSNDIGLYEHQQKHFHRLCEILTTNLYYGDTSDPGTGKTLLALAVALFFNLKLFVIGPESSLNHWREHAGKYQVTLIDEKAVMTYDSLRSTKGREPKHGFLTREEDPVTFTATERFRQYLKEGILLVFDEAHNLKNPGQARKAATALIKEFDRKGRSRFCFLSGTFTDKEDTAAGFLRMVGVITAPHLYSGRKGSYVFQGIQEVLDDGERISKSRMNKFLQRNIFTPTIAGAKKYVFAIFCDVYVSTLFSHMPNVLEQHFHRDEKNGFYRLVDRKGYEKAISYLKDITSSSSKESFKNMTQALLNLEMIKAPIMVRKAREHLTASEGAKVILFVNYHRVVNYLGRQLAEYSPLYITGETGDRKNLSVTVARFQEPSSKYRLLIGTVRAGGISLNLQDTDGRFPRFLYIMPNYYALCTIQSGRRTFREGMKGSAYIRHVYGEGGELEQKILHSLVLKSNKIKKIMKEQVKEGMVLPGDLDSEHEDVESQSN